jgi:hypothetical protein
MCRPVGDNTRTHLEGSETPSTNISNPSQATPERLTDDDESTLYSASEPDQPTDPNRTVVNMVPTAMSRPLGDNMRTHLEGMEDTKEMTRMAEDNYPYITPNVQGEMQREIGNNQRSYIEGMVEKDAGEDDVKKKKKVWHKR